MGRPGRCVLVSDSREPEGAAFQTATEGLADNDYAAGFLAERVAGARRHRLFSVQQRPIQIERDQARRSHLPRDIAPDTETLQTAMTLLRDVGTRR